MVNIWFVFAPEAEDAAEEYIETTLSDQHTALLAGACVTLVAFVGAVIVYSGKHSVSEAAAKDDDETIPILHGKKDDSSGTPPGSCSQTRSAAVECSPPTSPRGSASLARIESIYDETQGEE